MRGALRDRLIKGLGAQGYGQAVNILIQVVTVPLLIHAWGVTLYGEWLILSAIPVYLAMSDVGFTTAAQNDMTIAVGKGDRDAVFETFQSTWLLVLAVSLAVIAAVTVAVTTLPLDIWLNLANMSGAGVGWVLALLSLRVAVGLQAGLIYCGFHYRGSYGLGQSLLASMRLVELLFLAIVIIFGGDPVAAASALLAGCAVGAIAMRVILRRVDPDIEFGWQHARLATVKRLAPPALAFTAFPLGHALNVQGVVIVIGAVLGPAAVAVFATLRTLTRFGIQLVGSVNRIVQAEIAIAFGAGDTDLLRKLHHYACQAALWLSIAVAIGLAVFGAWIVRVWTDGAIEMQHGLFYLLLAVVIVNGLWHASLMLVYATNRHQRAALVYVGASVIAVAGAYWGALYLGLMGVAGVLLAADVAIAAYVCRSSLSLLNESAGQFARTLATAPLFVLRGLRRGRVRP